MRSHFRGRRTLLSFRSLWLLPFLVVLPASAQDQDNLNEIVTVTIEEGRVTSMVSRPIPPSDNRVNFVAEPSFENEIAAGPPEKISPLLQEMIESRDPKEKELVIINFHDDEQISRFPALNPAEPRSSLRNQEKLVRRAELAAALKARRDAAQRRRIRELGPRFGVEFVNNFWLVDAMIVRMPLGAVKPLADLLDVLYIEPAAHAVEPPVGDGNAFNDVIDGRAVITSDPYFNLGLTGGFIGLVDSGMRWSHVQFNNPNRSGFRGDCVNGTGIYCTEPGTNFDPSDCFNNGVTIGHGTSSAAILTGNANQGNDYRGVTGIILDSFKVYGASATTTCGVFTADAIQGMEAAISAGDSVIIAELQIVETDQSVLSTTADKAFDAGIAVIAANGNNGPNAGTVTAPANAHKALGVGAVDVQTQALYSDQGRGPTADQRIKPDIQAPTNTETAGASSDTALQVFGGTSGATPYAGGVAALFHNWLLNQGASGSPGQVYAYMILSGQRTAIDNNYGAGVIVMPTGGSLSRGSVSIAAGQTIDIPLVISGTVSRLDGALWWPETAAQTHNNVNLYVIAPDGTQYSSLQVGSVFERARATGSFSGTWKLRIHGFSVPAGPQTVFWAAHFR